MNSVYIYCVNSSPIITFIYHYDNELALSKNPQNVVLYSLLSSFTARYQVTVYTGYAFGAGTTAKVMFAYFNRITSSALKKCWYQHEGHPFNM